MSIKIEKVKDHIDFPVVRESRSTGQVVMFFSDRVGVVIAGSTVHPVGKLIDDWRPITDSGWLPVTVTIEG